MLCMYVCMHACIYTHDYTCIDFYISACLNQLGPFLLLVSLPYWGANLVQLKQDIVAKEKEIQPMVQKEIWLKPLRNLGDPTW